MTALFTCSKCKTAYSVSSEGPGRYLLKKTMRCPTNCCDGKLKFSSRTNIKLGFEAVKISALELYQAILGAGLPEEKKCSSKDMRKILVGAKITAAHIDEVPGVERSLLFSLTLNNKKVVHLATSSLGATIYKITEVSHGR